jgi:hypothetical protein
MTPRRAAPTRPGHGRAAAAAALVAVVATALVGSAAAQATVRYTKSEPPRARRGLRLRLASPCPAAPDARALQALAPLGRRAQPAHLAPLHSLPRPPPAITSCSQLDAEVTAFRQSMRNDIFPDNGWEPGRQQRGGSLCTTAMQPGAGGSALYAPRAATEPRHYCALRLVPASPLRVHLAAVVRRQLWRLVRAPGQGWGEGIGA